MFWLRGLKNINQYSVFINNAQRVGLPDAVIGNVSFSGMSFPVMNIA